MATGEIWMDRHCFEADGVLGLNRIKLHTCFSGPVQSGLTKMMVVGMGKIKSAETFHSAPTPVMKDMLLEMGACVIESGKIFAGLALLEDGFDGANVSFKSTLLLGCCPLREDSLGHTRFGPLGTFSRKHRTASLMRTVCIITPKLTTPGGLGRGSIDGTYCRW